MDRQSRTAPAVALLICVAVFGAHHLYFESVRRGYLVVLALVPMIGMLALGGLVHPPLLWSIGPHRHEQTPAVRVVGALLALTGAVLGMLLAVCGYRFFG